MPKEPWPETFAPCQSVIATFPSPFWSAFTSEMSLCIWVHFCIQQVVVCTWLVCDLLKCTNEKKQRLKSSTRWHLFMFKSWFKCRTEHQSQDPNTRVDDGVHLLLTCLQVTQRSTFMFSTVAFTPDAKRTWERMNLTADCPFKQTRCVHTNQTNWILRSSDVKAP